MMNRAEMKNYISGLKIGQSHQFLADRININTDFSKSNLQDLCDLVGDDFTVTYYKEIGYVYVTRIKQEI